MKNWKKCSFYETLVRILKHWLPHTHYCATVTVAKTLYFTEFKKCWRITLYFTECRKCWRTLWRHFPFSTSSTFSVLGSTRTGLFSISSQRRYGELSFFFERKKKNYWQKFSKWQYSNNTNIYIVTIRRKLQLEICCATNEPLGSF